MLGSQWLKLTLVVGSVLLVSCSDEGEDKARYGYLWDHLFSSCALNCHSPGSGQHEANGPDMSSRNAFYNGVVGKSTGQHYPSWLRGGSCDTAAMIKPGNAAQSTLPASLIAAYTSPLEASYNCTSSYNIHQVNQVQLTDSALIEALISWINNGAANN